jgi:FtsZ-binding cell division protein ZapB
VAELAHRIWQHLRTQAEQHPAQFLADQRFGANGWRYEGSIATLIREAVPDVPDADMRRARAHLDAAGMLVNVRGSQRGGGRPEWFIRTDWHEGTGGHVLIRGPRAPQTATTDPDAVQPEQTAGQPREDVVEVLRSLIDRVTALQSENDLLTAENDELRQEAQRLQAENSKLTENAEIARRAAELLSRLRD